jgi:hypothetical protein
MCCPASTWHVGGSFSTRSPRKGIWRLWWRCIAWATVLGQYSAIQHVFCCIAAVLLHTHVPGLAVLIQQFWRIAVLTVLLYCQGSGRAVSALGARTAHETTSTAHAELEIEAARFATASILRAQAQLLFNIFWPDSASATRQTTTRQRLRPRAWPPQLLFP